MRNVAVVLLSFSVSAFVTVACVSLVKTCIGAQVQQSAAPHDATRARPDGCKAVPTYEQDDFWPF